MLPERLPVDVFPPPDAIGMGRAADQVDVAVPVEVFGENIRALGADAFIGPFHFDRVKGPRSFGSVGGRFPPAVADDHVVASVLIEIADSQPVIEPVRSVIQSLLLRVAREADRIKRPLRMDLGRGGDGKIAHLVLWLGTENQLRLSAAGEVEKIGRLITRAMPDEMFLPMAGGVLWILEPVELGAGEPDQDQVDPTVAIHVITEVAKAVAVAAVVDVFAGSLDLMHLPIRGFVPDVAGDDVHLPIVIDIERGHPLRAERFIEIGPLPANIVAPGEGRSDDDKTRDIEASPFDHAVSPE